MAHRAVALVLCLLWLAVLLFSSFSAAAHRTSSGGPPLVRSDPRRRATIHAVDDATPGVFTYHNDWARTGQNLHETILTPRTVNPRRFGLLNTHYDLDGYVFAQPLYAPNISINGSTYNLVIVVTEHDTVYAFDADVDRHPLNWASPLWMRSLLNAGSTPVPTEDERDNVGTVCHAVQPEVGITSTPVIDPATGTLYVVAKSKEADETYAYRLYALDVATGLDNLSIGEPVQIEVRDFVTEKSSVPFNALRQNQHAGLALANGVVYVAFASYCDQTPYHGWVLGYDTTNRLTRVATFNTSPQSNLGGIWGSGAAPAIDSDGSLFVTVGNGPFDPNAGHWGDSVLKLPVDRPTVIDREQFGVLDYFEPFNQDYLSANDLDLGTGGMLLLPDQPGPHAHVMVGGGKQGIIYVIDRDQMTVDDQHQAECSDAELAALAIRGLTQTCDPILQAFKTAIGHTTATTPARVYRGPGTFSTPSYWNGHVYIGSAGDNLKMCQLQQSLLVDRPASMSPTIFPFPGVTASISANGNLGGIVWVVDSGDVTSTPAVLYAFDASDLSHVLYKSTGTIDDQRNAISPSNDTDTMTVGVRFSVPTVYGGKVFVATRTQLHVFGLRR